MARRRVNIRGTSHGKATPTRPYTGPAPVMRPAAPSKPAPAKSAPAAPTGQPGAPPPAPPPTPFLTPEQQAELSAILFGTQQEINEIDHQVRSSAAERDYQTQATDKQAGQAREDVTDDAIGRGIFQSSIRDGELADVEATRALRKRYFAEAHDRVVTRGEQRKRDLHARLTGADGHGLGVHANFDQRAVANAAALPVAVPPPAKPVLNKEGHPVKGLASASPLVQTPWTPEYRRELEKKRREFQTNPPKYGVLSG